MPVCDDDLNKMIFEENDQYPKGEDGERFMPKGKTEIATHVRASSVMSF